MLPLHHGSVCHTKEGFDHGAGHPLLFLNDAKAPNCRKNHGFKDLGNYSEWPKVAGVVIKAPTGLQMVRATLPLISCGDMPGGRRLGA